MKNVVLSVAILSISFRCFSQDNTEPARFENSSKKNIFSLRAGGKYGFIFAHSGEVENTKGSYPFGVELMLSWQRNDQKAWDLCNCYPAKGLQLAYYNYDNNILGRGFIAAYFLEPSYSLGKDVFFSFKGAAGLAYLTQPHHAVHNPNNMSYSSALSGYVAVGTGIHIRLHDKWRVNPSLNYQHISNGGMRQPNKGINWPTAGLTLNYIPQPMPYFTNTRSREKFWKDRPVHWDIGLFGMPRRAEKENDERKRVMLFGLHLQAGKQVGRISTLTAGLEFSHDRSLHEQLKKDSIDASATRAGILIGHEFLLGKFIFTQRLGAYLFDQTPYYDAVYHSWGIHFRANKNIAVGLNLKAHRHVAEYIDARLAYSFRRN